MSEQVQIRRGTASQNASFVGAQAELTVDTDNNKLILHNGVTPGGSVIASEAFVLSQTSSNVALIESQVASINANVALVNSNAATLNSTVSAISTALNIDTLNITTLQGNVVTLNSEVVGLTSSVAGINTAVNNNSANISILRGNVVTIDSAIANNSSNISILRGNVVTIDSAIANNSSNISILRGNVVTIDSAIANNSSNISILQGNVVGIESSVNTLLGNVTILDATISTHNTNENLTLSPNGTGNVVITRNVVVGPVTVIDTSGNWVGPTITGLQGIQGNTGPQGIQGNIGPQGIQGNTGPIGPAGPSSSIIYDIAGLQSDNMIVTGTTQLQGTTGANVVLLSPHYSNMNYKVQLTYANPSGTPFYANMAGYLYYTVTSTNSFKIYSSNNTDANHVTWQTTGSVTQ